MLNQIRLLVILLLLSFQVYAKDLHEHQAVLKILEITGVEHNGTLEDIVAKTQKSWLNIQGADRVHIKKEMFIDQRIELLNEFRKIGYLKSQAPSSPYFDAVILIGASARNIRKRISTILYLHKQGISFKKIIVLTGDRPLVEEFEPKDIILKDEDYKLKLRQFFPNQSKLPTTERELVHFYLTNLLLPKKLNKLPVFIYSSEPVEKDGKVYRATTAQTIRNWLNEDETIKPGMRYLAISSQPQTGYQVNLVRHFLKGRKVIVDVSGYKAEEDVTTDMMLDSLARHLWIELANRQNLKLAAK